MMWRLFLALSIGAWNIDSSQTQLIYQFQKQSRQSYSHLFNFLQDLQAEYFPGCSLVILHGSSSPKGYQRDPAPHNVSNGQGFGDGVWTKDLESSNTKEDSGVWVDHGTIVDQLLHYYATRGSTRIVFTLNQNLSEVLRNGDLNSKALCPVYITFAGNISMAQKFFLMTNRDWDKYFLMRKHVIFTYSAQAVLEDFLNMGEISTMTNLLFVRLVANSSSLHILTNCPYDQPSVHTLMTWQGRPMTQSKNLFVDKLTNLHGHKMRVVTFHFPPRIFMEELRDGGHLLYGVDIEVVKALSTTLNFSLSFSQPSDGEMWGWEQENGSWTGLMGDLQRRKADIGVADLYIMEQYFGIIDMSREYDIEYLCFVNPTLGPLPQWMALGLPFLLETWVAVLVTVLVGMLAMVLMAWLGLRSGWMKAESPWFHDSGNICLLLFSAVLNTTWIREPSSLFLRVFVLLWSLAFFIVAVAYKGSLVSYLTVPLQQPPVDTHKQLLEKGVKVGSIGLTFKRVMEKNADRYVRRLAERYQLVPSTREGLQRTVQGSYSFLESRGFLEYTIAVDYTDMKGRETLHIMKEYVAPFGIGLAYPKYAPYIVKFNHVIIRMKEAGLAKKWLDDIILKRKQAKISSGDSQESAAGAAEDPLVRPLTTHNLQGCFILMILGYGIAFLAFTVELLLKFVVHRCRKW